MNSLSPNAFAATLAKPMNLLIPSSRISRQCHACPDCQAPTPVDVVTEIRSDEDLSDFIALRLNRARCSACGALVEAPVRVTVRFPDFPAANHDCVPMALLENPEVLDDLLHHPPDGTHRVYSHDELQRSIEACFRLEMHRHNFSPQDLRAALARAE